MDKMTIFYSKNTGKINCYCTGVQDINYFGEFKEDLEAVFTFIVVPLDNFVLKNIELFIVNIETKQLKLKSNPQYTVAQ